MAPTAQHSSSNSSKAAEYSKENRENITQFRANTLPLIDLVHSMGRLPAYVCLLYKANNVTV